MRRTAGKTGMVLLAGMMVLRWTASADVTTGPLAEKGPDDVPALIEALNDETMGRRWNAALVLGEIGDKSAVPALIERVKTDEHPRVRRRAMDALGKIGAVEAVPALIEALKSDDELERRDAARTLGEIGEKSAVPALIEALKDGEGFVRRDAARALGALGDRSAVPALQELSKESVEEYSFERPLAPHEESPAARAAVFALMELGGETLVPAMRQLLASELSHVRGHTLTIVAEMGARAEEGVELITPLLADKDSGVREEAIEALRSIGGASAVKALAQAFTLNPTPWDQPVVVDLMRAARALEELGDASALPALEAAFETARGEGNIKGRSDRLIRDLRSAINALQE